MPWPGPLPGGIRACRAAAYSEQVTRLRIALAQANSTVGDLSGNAAAVLEWTRRAAVAGADLVVFPEMMLTGYPVEDLALRASFVSASIATLEDTARRLADAGLGGIAVVTGYLGRQEGLAARVGVPAGAPLDAAALLYGGRVVVTSAKHHLPNYGVFDEYRYFVPGNCLPVVRVPAAGGGAVDVAIAICEDLWQDGGPVAVTRQAGAGLLVVPNASPYERGKSEARFELVARRAREAGAALAYVNMMGGQDELVFDGDSIIVDAAGELLARGPQFEETLLVADLDLPAAAGPLPSRQPGRRARRHHDDDYPGGAVWPGPGWGTTRPATRAADLGQARPAGRGVRRAGHRDPRLRAEERLPLGHPRPVRRDRFRAGGHHRRRRARPGPGARGADAQQVLLRALGRRRRGPGQAAGAAGRTVPIAPMVDAFEAELDLAGLAAENLQSRIRGVILMGLSNAAGHLVLTTGNKSEIATGYSTLYGDSAGGFGPIKDVLKTLVWDLARWRNEKAAERGETPPIPENSITKPPSAELKPGQLDTDSLPDYAVLDPLLDDYVEKDMGAAQLVAAGHDPALVDKVIQLVDRAEYKRRQYPPGPKITIRNFGRDRRLPITSRWREPRPASPAG